MTSIGAMTGVSLFTVSIAFGIGSKPWEILFLFFIVKAWSKPPKIVNANFQMSSDIFFNGKSGEVVTFWASTKNGFQITD